MLVQAKLIENPQKHVVLEILQDKLFVRHAALLKRRTSCL